MTERQIHAKIAKYLRSQRIFFFHVPNEGRRDRREAGILRAMGVVPGIPDLIVPIPHVRAGQPVAGLAMEVKTPRGQLTEPQRRVMAVLHRCGWHCAIVRSLDDAIRECAPLTEEARDEI